MKRIAVEEHGSTREYSAYLQSCASTGIPRIEVVADEKGVKHTRHWLTSEVYMTSTVDVSKQEARGDLGNVELRLREMDEAGIDMQVLSVGNPISKEPDPAAAVAWAAKINDDLARLVNRYPDRFAAFARVTWTDPVAAAAELKRAVTELGLKGAKVDSHVNGEYLDDPKFWPVFAKAAELDVPIYVHPREPSLDMIKPFLAYPGLPFAMWGYAAETSLHAIRLICSGLFDEFPNLKIILGHMGEGLPFWLWRLDNMWRKSQMVEQRKKIPSEYFKDNFFVSTSGMFSQPALMCTYLALGADNILFAVDYPSESAVEAVQFMDAVPICADDKEKIYHRNVEKLLGLAPDI